MRRRSVCQRTDGIEPRAYRWGTMDLFEELIKDEEGHIDFIETQLDLMAQIGKENYGQLQADPADEAEGH